MIQRQKAFPHVKKGTPERKAIADKIKQYRAIEEGRLSHTWQTTRRLVDLESPTPGMNVIKEVDNLHRKLGRKVKVFEVGTGEGHSLRALKLFRGNIAEVDGITLTQKAANQAAGKDEIEGRSILHTRGSQSIIGTITGHVPTVKVRVGLIEGLKLAGQDFIFSFQSMRYVIDRARALEVIANGLNPGGKAILQVPAYFLGKDEKHIQEYFQRHGFKLKVKKVRIQIKYDKWMREALAKRGQDPKRKRGTLGRNRFIVIERIGNQPVDLKKFYRIRTNDMWQEIDPRPRRKAKQSKT
ncbi:MAG: class I SAM-dependent methyltransferase [Candidatus Diapherotrites archaeon]|nr:class I SAM-dependent methyltransferase [Candidatus Diapherotrites archaeon]